MHACKRAGTLICKHARTHARTHARMQEGRCGKRTRLLALAAEYGLRSYSSTRRGVRCSRNRGAVFM